MSEAAELFALLATPTATLTKTIAAVDALEKIDTARRRVSLGISSNVSVDLMSVYLRKHALLNGAQADVRLGNHDDPVTDIDQFVRDGIDEMVFLQFFDNLMPAFERQIELLSPDAIAAKEDDFRARCRLVFEKARTLRRVYVCSFHRFVPAVDLGTPDAVGRVLTRFDAVLRKEAESFANVRIVDTEAIVRLLGTNASFDSRFYIRNTAPYTPVFLNELARRIATSSRGFDGYFYKALVLDCDNTLWGGVVGEDLVEGIKLDPHSYPGKVYWQAQHDFLALERQGALLCLCSKNNAEDVDEVLEKHPFMVLRKDDLAIRKVNWTDKVANLQAIARELNIGLDSLVFVDDSDFECAAVRSALPMVRVFQVPKALSDYPRVLWEIRELFLSGGVSAESRSKTEQYRQRQEAVEASAQFETHEQYLASLELSVHIARNDNANIARIGELTMKSNQFNLTTLRQTSAQIQELMSGTLSTVYSLNVSDRFGNAGLTGVAIVRRDADVARVDAFLMSCRVIGRGVEFCFWPELLADARRNGCKSIEAEYRPTAKNALVADFYERLGLPLVSEDNGVKRYRSALDAFTPLNIDWIKVTQ